MSSRFCQGMVIEEVLRGLDGRGVDYHASHYRTAAGGDVALVLEGDFGLLPIEIKHGQTVRVQELQALLLGLEALPEGGRFVAFRFEDVEAQLPVVFAQADDLGADGIFDVTL